MRIRAGCILIEHGRVALIERHRAGRHYFTFPGGGVDVGEPHEQAAVREMQEELGLQVRVLRRIAEVHFNGNLQPYFLVETISGEFGSGTGDEFCAYDPMYGSYHPLWMPVTEILNNNVVPHELAQLVFQSVERGWPEETQVLFETRE
jgi:8-oxo-dGTP pyrophosphatase MutT (NUDIX family)